MKALIVAREPGAANALAPVARRVGAEVIAYDHALKTFVDRGVTPRETRGEETPTQVAELIGEVAPDVLLTGTSRGALAPRDAVWWRAASAAGIPCTAMVDHWLGYAERFSVRTPFDSLPDSVLVPDDHARTELVAAGCPSAIITAVGHPAFDGLAVQALTARDAVRERWHASPGQRVLLFASEPISADLGRQRGYDELEVLDMLLRALTGKPVRLVIRPHPRERADGLAAVVQRHGATAEIESRLSALDAAQGADAVAGITSILLLESALLGRPVLSIQPRRFESWPGNFPSLIAEAADEPTIRAWVDRELVAGARTVDDRRLRAQAAGFDDRATERVAEFLRAKASARS